jgi:hypothetical protein
MASPEHDDRPASSPLDAEREKLRKAGYSDTEISQILVARALGSPGPVADATSSQGVLSSGLSSVVAIGHYARGTAFTIRHDLGTVFDAAATASARVGAATMLVFKAAVISVLAYAGWQEWRQHIISATEIAAANANKAHAEECSARIKAIGEIAPLNKLSDAFEFVQRDCDPTYASRKATRSQDDAAIDLIRGTMRAEAEFKAGHYDEAFRLQQQSEGQMEAYELKLDGALGTASGGSLSHLAWIGLFARQFSKSLDASERATRLSPNDLEPVAKKAHALMFLGRDAEAKAIYLAHTGELVQGKTWKNVISEDFTKLREAGITRPMMAEVEKELAPGQNAASILPTLPPPIAAGKK